MFIDSAVSSRDSAAFERSFQRLANAGWPTPIPRLLAGLAYEYVDTIQAGDIGRYHLRIDMLWLHHV